MKMVIYHVLPEAYSVNNQDIDENYYSKGFLYVHKTADESSYCNGCPDIIAIGDDIIAPVNPNENFAPVYHFKCVDFVSPKREDFGFIGRAIEELSLELSLDKQSKREMYDSLYNDHILAK